LIFELLHVTFDFFSNLQHPANYGIWLEITRSQIPGSPHLVHVASSRLLCFHGSSSSVWASKGQLRRLQFDKRVQWHVNWCNMSELNVQIYQSMKNRVCRSAMTIYIPDGWLTPSPCLSFADGNQKIAQRSTWIHRSAPWKSSTSTRAADGGWQSPVTTEWPWKSSCPPVMLAVM
jgi:hypothetical protein